MKNNISKTEILVVNSNQPNMEIRLNDGEEIIVKTKSFIKILGILIDEKLNWWDKQINNVKRKSLNTTRFLHSQPSSPTQRKDKLIQCTHLTTV